MDYGGTLWPIARVSLGILLRRKMFWVLYAFGLLLFLMFFFGNFLIEALKYRGKGEQLVKGKLEPMAAGAKTKAANAGGGGSNIPATGF